MITVERIAPDATAQLITMRSHEIVADVDAAAGGIDAGPSPHDLYDAALGACTALTVVWYAQRNAIQVEDVRASISRDATAERQGMYRLSVRLAVTGPLDSAQRARLLDVAAKCPVHKLMTEVTTEIHIEMVDIDDGSSGKA